MSDDDENERYYCCIPADARMLFVGDSTMRYQYLALAHALRHGIQWLADAPNASLVNEKTLPTWTEFFNFTTEHLAPFGVTSAFGTYIAAWWVTPGRQSIQWPMDYALLFGIFCLYGHGTLLTGCVRRQEEAAGLYLASGGRAREMQARYTYPLHLLYTLILTLTRDTGGVGVPHGPSVAAAG